MTSKLSKLLGGSALTLPAMAMALGMTAAQAAEPIKIGVLYPIAGTGAIYGTPAMHGHDMAVDEVNAKGGILGRKVETVARDTKLNPAAAAAAAKELITNQKNPRMIGGDWFSIFAFLKNIPQVSRRRKIVNPILLKK